LSLRRYRHGLLCVAILLFVGGYSLPKFVDVPAVGSARESERRSTAVGITAMRLSGESRALDARMFWGHPTVVDSRTHRTAGETDSPSPSGEEASQRSFLRREILSITQLVQGTVVNSEVPADLVTPAPPDEANYISVPAARWQAQRVAEANRIPIDQVWAVIVLYTEMDPPGSSGASRVNVPALNVAINGLVSDCDATHPCPSSQK
jgi:K+-transporting ATPase c subunit